jgi:hypothetical protein
MAQAYDAESMEEVAAKALYPPHVVECVWSCKCKVVSTQTAGTAQLLGLEL